MLLIKKIQNFMRAGGLFFFSFFSDRYEFSPVKNFQDSEKEKSISSKEEDFLLKVMREKDFYQMF